MKAIKFYSLQLIKEKSVKFEDTKRISDPQQVFNIATQILQLHLKAKKYCYMLTLNTKNDVIGIFEISHGSIHCSIVTPREVWKRALLSNATSIIILHNHPSGDPNPSQEDLQIALLLRDTGELLNIELLDFIIIGENNYCSFKKEGLM